MTLQEILSEMRLRILELNRKENDLKERRMRLRVKYSHLSDDEINKLSRTHPFNQKDYKLLEELSKVWNEQEAIRDMLNASGYLNEND